MIKIIFLALALVITTTQNVYGVDKTSLNTVFKAYGKETLNDLKANGTVNLAGTKVLGLTDVTGNLKAEEATLNSLQINGQAEIFNSTVTHLANINGFLIAENTTFEKPLSVASGQIILKKCNLDSVTMRPVAGYAGMQIVDLREGSHVTGNIVVESGKGEVWVSQASKITQDQVSGAKLVRM